jgi:hypothetical protein
LSMQTLTGFLFTIPSRQPACTHMAGKNALSNEEIA